MCRKEQYQTRIVHEGVKHLHEKSATLIQAAWRGHVVRSWYRKLRQSIPPKDPKLRCKFYEEKLKSITDRMLKSIDYDVNGFLGEIDRSLEASRDIFRHFDNVVRVISDVDWTNIEAKAIERGDTDCPICLMRLDISTDIWISTNPTLSQNAGKTALRTAAGGTQASVLHPCCASSSLGSAAPQTHPSLAETTASGPTCENRRSVILLSCSHVFHATCLQALEEFTAGEGRNVCPVCRSHYRTKTIQR
jgi:hypothetical protein